MTSWRVRFPSDDDTKRARSIVALETAGVELKPRQIKGRRGCKQCKLQKVKCDEASPTCNRCAARGLNCSGSDASLPWRARINIRQYQQPARIPAWPNRQLQTELLQYWFTKASSVMALEPPESNPISGEIAWMLANSKALVYSIQSISHGHLNFFNQTAMAPALEDRQKALLSLRYELADSDAWIMASPKVEVLLLTILLLGISAGWFDHNSHDFGQQHLYGAEAAMQLILQSDPPYSEFATYLVGVYIYWNMCCSFLGDPRYGLENDQRVWNLAQRMRAAAVVHPMTGIATDLMLTMTQVGRYCRHAVASGQRDPQTESHLETTLREWQPPKPVDAGDLEIIAEAYKLTGLIMIYRIRRSVESEQFGTGETDETQIIILAMRVLTILLNIPLDSPRISVSGWLLTIVACEIPSEMLEIRNLIRDRFRHLHSTLRLGVTLRGLDVVRDCWVHRDRGDSISWLEVMNEHGWLLMMG